MGYFNDDKEYWSLEKVLGFWAEKREGMALLLTGKRESRG